MPLQVTDGIPIPTTFTMPGNFTDALPKPQIDIVRSPQKEDAWCYAACAEMVINFLWDDDVTRQCEVVSYVKETTCCNNMPEVCTEKGCREEQVGKIFTKYKVLYDGYDPDDPEEIGEIDIERIRTDISAEARRPIEVVVKWNTGTFNSSSSHAFLITGVNGDSVYVVDPLPGIGESRTGWHPIHSLRDGFGYGRWVRTWPGLRRL